MIRNYNGIRITFANNQICAYNPFGPFGADYFISLGDIDDRAKYDLLCRLIADAGWDGSISTAKTVVRAAGFELRSTALYDDERYYTVQDRWPMCCVL